MRIEDDLPANNSFSFKRHVLPVISAAILLCAAAGVGWLYMASRELGAPIMTSDKFVYALLDKDTDKAYDLTSDSFKAATSREELDSIAELASKNFKRESLRTTEGSRETGKDNAEIAVINYDVQGGGDNYQLSVKVVRYEKDKKWQVLSVTNSVKKQPES